MLRLQIAPKRRWHLTCESSHVALDLYRVLRSEHNAGNGRMAQGKMQRRGRQGNAMSSTDAFDLLNLCQDLRRRVLIVVFGAGNGAGCQNARIEYAAEQHGDALSHGQRQEVLERRLLQ